MGKKVKIIETVFPDKVGEPYYDSTVASLKCLDDCIRRVQEVKLDIVRFRVSHEEMPHSSVACLCEAALLLSNAKKIDNRNF